MNKKGDEKIMSLWWFFVIVIIAVTIVGGVLLYYGADVDVREIESRVLSDRVAECLVLDYQINKNLFLDNFDIFEECKLNKDLFEEESNYYLRVRVLKLDGKLLGDERHYGQRAFEDDCIVSRSLSEDKFAKCSFLNIKTLDENQSVFLEIISASDQKGRRNNIIR